MFPLPTIACTLTANGITTPPLQDIISSLIASMQIIFGVDIYVDNSTSDYQMLALIAQAQYDSNLATIAVASQFNPQTATGQGLDSAIKTNGIFRDDPAFSTAVCVITGRVGYQIPAGTLLDVAGNQWTLPLNLTIQPTGTVTATATCTVAGPVTADVNSLAINSIQVGWDAVTNLAAIPGSVVETDGVLRQRQTISTALPSRTQLGAISGAVANVPGVQDSIVYQNDTNVTDANGLPPHSCSVVVAGGDVGDVARAIELTKDGGCGTYGSTTEVVNDPNGLPIPINFWELDEVQVYVGVTIATMAGFAGNTEYAISAAVAAFINSLAIGKSCWPSWVNAAAALVGTSLEETFVITALMLGTAPVPTGAAVVPIAFNQKAVCLAANVVVTT